MKLEAHVAVPGRNQLISTHNCHIYLQIARKLHSDLHPMQMIKMNSYHNPTLFVDDEKVFVAGSEDHRVSTFSKSRIYKPFGVMHNKASSI